MSRARRAEPPAGPVRDVQELCLWLAGTAARRQSKQERIRALARRVDADLLAYALHERRMLPLAGGRLVELAGDAVGERFREHTARATLAAGRRATLFTAATHRLLASLEGAGVAAIPLKGPLLAERIHGDASMRGSVDIDLLVGRDDFARAIDVLRSQGYGKASGSPWYADLPLFEATVAPEEPWLPRVDLHWRVHWYEEDFSTRLLERSTAGDGGIRVPSPEDELAAMLLYYARDGFWGLRPPTDIAAWWDVYGEPLPEHALDEVVSEHPRLRPAITTAAAVAGRVTGLPARRVLSRPAEGDRRTVRAGRLANWDGGGVGSAHHSTLVLVDWLLTPPGDRGMFVQRHFLPPRSAITRIYSLPANASARRLLRRAYFATSVGARVFPRAVAAAWHTRRGRTWPALPDCPRLTAPDPHTAGGG